MIDRDARNSLACLIRRYLGDSVTSFDFDDSLDAYARSPDSAVRFVANDLWRFYDDCKDHLVVLSKPQWNYIQRLLLLLESNDMVTLTTHRRWRVSQIGAAVLLLGCVGITLTTGIGYHLLLCFMPFGACSIAITFSRRPLKPAHPYHDILAPFHSFSSLCHAYDETHFLKVRYPSHLATRFIRSPLDSSALSFSSYVGWLCLAPLVLFVQCLPISDTEVAVTPA